MKITGTICTILVAVAIAALAGCATKDSFTVRVLEYGASGGVVTSAELGGCAVHQNESPASAAGKQSVDVYMVYHGEKCGAVINSRQPSAAPAK